MNRIKGVKRLTENRFLNLYELDARQRDGKAITYYVASRAKAAEDLKSVSGHRRADGVIMYGVYGENRDKIVLVRQYRYPLGDYIYEFPAGLVEPGEDVREAGIREMFEETGLTFTPREGGDFERPFFTTVGMTDESCALVFGYCEGEPTNANQEAAEDIQVVLADKAECRRILREENVAIMPAYMMMHFLGAEGDPLEFLRNAELKNVVIRPMMPADAEAKAYVHWKSCLETYTGLMDPDFLAASTLDKYHAIALRFVETTLVAEVDGKIVGFGCWDPKGEIPALYVLRDAQGYGIGRRLLETMLERLADCKQVRLEVLEGNDRAIGFYEHMGFRMDGTSNMTKYSAVHPVLGMIRAV